MIDAPTPDTSPAQAANEIELTTAQLSIDDTAPAEGDVVSLEAVQGTVVRISGDKLTVRIDSVAGAELPVPGPAADEYDDALRAASLSDASEA